MDPWNVRIHDEYAEICRRRFIALFVVIGGIVLGLLYAYDLFPESVQKPVRIITAELLGGTQ